MDFIPPRFFPHPLRAVLIVSPLYRLSPPRTVGEASAQLGTLRKLIGMPRERNEEFREQLMELFDQTGTDSENRIEPFSGDSSRAENEALLTTALVAARGCALGASPSPPGRGARDRDERASVLHPHRGSLLRALGCVPRVIFDEFEPIDMERYAAAHVDLPLHGQKLCGGGT